MRLFDFPIMLENTFIFSFTHTGNYSKTTKSDLNINVISTEYCPILRDKHNIMLIVLEKNVVFLINQFSNKSHITLLPSN